MQPRAHRCTEQPQTDTTEPRGAGRQVTDDQDGLRAVPEVTIARLPGYLRALTLLAEAGAQSVSSEELARAAGVNSAKLRKDLSHLGSYGVRGVGYEVQYLMYQMARELGLTHDWPVAIVGMGNLGQALAGYAGFSTRGFRVVALFDIAPEVIGRVISGLTVQHLGDLDAVLRDQPISIGVIATPAGPAQAVCDRLVASGVASVLNFAPGVVTVPAGVELRKVDLSTELQILAYHEQRKLLPRVGSAEQPTIAETTGTAR
ncbi:MAG: redox-sensing transcriptional repressor Rex [Angustibacter sp.]